MKPSLIKLLLSTPALLLFASFTTWAGQQQELVDDPSPIAQAELRAVVQAIANDVMNGNIEQLQAVHLVSEKFTKFGPRNFDRQDVASTNASEAAFFSSISEVDYRVRELKIDVFGDIGIVTYYPQVSFVKDGEHRLVDARQTLVFLNTEDGWKIVHEHGTLRPSQTGDKESFK